MFFIDRELIIAISKQHIFNRKYIGMLQKMVSVSDSHKGRAVYKSDG